MQINVRHSLIDARTIKDLAESFYWLGDSRCELLTQGKHDTYLITGQNNANYIFRLYRSGHRNKEAYLFELDALNHLQSQGYGLAHPIRKSDGGYLTEMVAPEGLRYGVLFSYSEGERPQINEENSEVIGAALGRMHKLSSGFSSNHERGFELDTSHLLDEPAAVISPVLERNLGSEAVSILQTVVENTKDDLSEYNLEKGFCHGNFYNHNMHIHNGGINVFDFDCCAVGYRAYDIAVSWWNLKSDRQNMDEACWDAFLKGYFSERNLAAEDVRSLPLFITARRIRLMGTMIANDDVWGTNWINKRTLTLFIGQLRTDRPGDEDLRELDEHQPFL